MPEKFLKELKGLLSPTLLAFIEPDTSSESFPEAVAGEDLGGLDGICCLDILQDLVDAHPGYWPTSVILVGTEDVSAWVIDFELAVAHGRLLLECFVDA